jgi:rhamnose utilization protein RhaD (predicted bifunctional aldolase and dehydrogenase)
LLLKACLDENPGIRGIMLGSHGLFTWGDTAYESYVNTLEVVERCAQYLEDNYGRKRPVFGGAKISSLPKEERMKKAAKLAPLLRGLCSNSDNTTVHLGGKGTIGPFYRRRARARVYQFE